MDKAELIFDQSLIPIGKGGQASVFSAVLSGKKYALKQFSSLEDMMNEATVLLDLEKKTQGSFPCLYNIFRHEGGHAFLMDIYKVSLQSLHRRGELKERELFAYCIEIVEQLEKLHAAGYVHCDLKPDNVMVRVDGHATLIDFGLSHKYIDKRGQHIPFEKVGNFKGTYHFCSKNTLERIRQTRRDDMESLFYTIMRLCNVQMPWVPEQKTDRAEYLLNVKKRKMAMPDFEVMRVTSCSSVFLGYTSVFQATLLAVKEPGIRSKTGL